MKISPCIDTVYKGHCLKEALTEIKELGYEGFEFWHTDGHDLREMLELKTELGLEISNFDAEEISLADPSARKAFVQSFERAAETAKMLGCGQITVLSGNDTGKARAIQRKSIVDGLTEIAPVAEAMGVTAILEASNRRVNRPFNFLTSADEAFEIIDRVGSGNVKMLYDIYHQQISEGDLLARIIPNIGKIGHFHAAGVPDRHELDRCEINYDFLFRKIAEAGYERWVGLEYFPADPPKQGLLDLKKYLAL